MDGSGGERGPALRSGRGWSIELPLPPELAARLASGSHRTASGAQLERLEPVVCRPAVGSKAAEPEEDEADDDQPLFGATAALARLRFGAADDDADEATGWAGDSLSEQLDPAAAPGAAADDWEEAADDWESRGAELDAAVDAALAAGPDQPAEAEVDEVDRSLPLADATGAGGMFVQPVLVVDMDAVLRAVSKPPLPAAWSTAERRRMAEVVSRLLGQAFGAKQQQLFEMGAALHSTNSESFALLEQLRAAPPGDPELARFRVFEYPAALESGESVAELWGALRRRTDWDSLNELLQHLQAAGRGLVWKAALAKELAALAAQEARARYDRGEAADARAAELARLRQLVPLFESRVSASTDPSPEVAAQLRTMRARVDEILEHRDDPEEDDPPDSLLDLVLTMIFDATPRLPWRDEREHHAHLAEAHARVRELWRTEFGRLPPAGEELRGHFGRVGVGS